MQPDVRGREQAARPSASVLGDNEVLRRRLAALLERAGVEVVLPADGPGIVILALSPDGIRAEVLASAGAGECPRVAVLPRGLGPAEARRLLDAGLDGVVLEERVDDALLPTLHSVSAGQVAVPGELRRALSTPALSAREKQVLAMAIMGCPNAEIAQRLHLTESTVKGHLSSVFRKLGVRSRHEAAAAVLDGRAGLGLGILEIDPDARELI